MDIIIAVLGLIISLPVFVIVAVLIRIDSPGPILIRQERVGRDRASFRLLKFRSMIVGAEEEIVNLLGVNPLKRSTLKIPDDPRVTKVGKFLRRWSIDELPQLWNVLSGDMSLVGPRPEETWIVELYNDQQRQRLTMKPGLTGPMQVSGRGALDMEARLALELEYINNFSIWKDIKILIKTIPVVISGKGAY
jgi:lipopolysaccharide/colanic/teichoic acid biosynthesis glycosyltransferase